MGYSECDGYDGYGFEVRPQDLTAYADTLRAGAADLAMVGGTLGGVRVERAWFGKLPQSGAMEARYAGHSEAEIATNAELVAWLTAAAEALAASATRYSATDRTVADLAGTVEAGLAVAEPGGGGTGAGGESGDSRDFEDSEDPEDSGALG